MSQPAAGEVVARLGIDLSTLPLASAAELATAGTRTPGVCVACERPGQVVLIAATPLGHRWVDLCDRCFHLATAPRRESRPATPANSTHRDLRHSDGAQRARRRG